MRKNLAGKNILGVSFRFAAATIDTFMHLLRYALSECFWQNVSTENVHTCHIMVDGIPMTLILKGQLIARQRIIASQTEAFCAFSPMKKNVKVPTYVLPFFEIVHTTHVIAFTDNSLFGCSSSGSNKYSSVEWWWPNSLVLTCPF